MKAANDISTPFNVPPNGDARHATITATPTLVITAKSRNRPSPSNVPSPAKTIPFTKCINDDIAAGPFTACRTSNNGEKNVVIAGNAKYWQHANTIPSNVPQANIRSATVRAASLPPVARAEGTSAAAVPCIPRCITTPRLYICIVIPYAAADTPVGSSIWARRAAETNATLSIS